jgi:hypothetical protein
MFQIKVVDDIKTHILCPIYFSENHAVYEIMWKHNVQWGRPELTARRIHIDAGYLGLQMHSQAV